MLQFNSKEACFVTKVIQNTFFARNKCIVTLKSFKSCVLKKETMDNNVFKDSYHFSKDILAHYNYTRFELGLVKIIITIL